MQDILDRLNRVRGVGGCLVLSADGLPMLSALREGADENSIAAAIAGTLETGRKLCEVFELGSERGLQALAAQGGMLVMSAGPGYLAILLDPDANIALLTLEARPYAEKLAQRLKL